MSPIHQRATSSSPGESCAFVLRRLIIGGCCVAVSLVRSKCVTVLCMSLLREDRGVNGRVLFFFVCVKMIIVSRVNASRQSA